MDLKKLINDNMALLDAELDNKEAAGRTEARASARGS